MPDDLLARIDEAAGRRNTTRSGFLALAARRELARLTPDEADAIIARSRALFADAGPFEAADLVRAERDRTH